MSTITAGRLHIHRHGFENLDMRLADRVLICLGCGEQHPIAWYLCGKGMRVIDNKRKVNFCLVCRGIEQGWTLVTQIRPSPGFYAIHYGGQLCKVEMAIADLMNIIDTFEAKENRALAMEPREVKAGSKKAKGTTEEDQTVQTMGKADISAEGVGMDEDATDEDKKNGAGLSTEIDDKPEFWDRPNSSVAKHESVLDHPFSDADWE